MIEVDPLNDFNKYQRKYCNPNNKNKLSFTCFSEEDIKELVTIYNSDIAKSSKETITIKNKSILEIYNELKKKLQTYKSSYNKEFCWLKLREFKNKFINSDNLFIPEMPTEWCSQLKDWRESRIDAPWLSNFDIDEIIEQYETKYKSFKFLGSTPIDFQRKKYNSCILEVFNDDRSKSKWLTFDHNKSYCSFNPNAFNKNSYGIVFNTDNHDGGGKHWMGLYINVKMGVILFFDSAVTYVNVHPEIRLFVKNCEQQFKKKFNFKYNTVQHQQSNSECGMYSIYFILTMLDADESNKYNSIQIFDKFFNDSEKRITDKLMVLYRTKLFRTDCDC